MPAGSRHRQFKAPRPNVLWLSDFTYVEPIGNIPPAEAEQRYYAMLEQPAMAA
jgi:transposase InsO family protein